LLSTLKDENASVKTLVDVGCSGGDITYEFAVALKVDKTYGADIFPAEEYRAPDCAAESEKTWPGSKLHYVPIDTFKCTIALPDNTADLVTCIMSMHHYRDFDQMLQEITRILKPGGYLFIREHDVPDSNKELAHFLTEMHEKFEDHRPEEPISFWSRRDLRLELTSKYNLKHVRDSDFGD